MIIKDSFIEEKRRKRRTSKLHPSQTNIRRYMIHINLICLSIGLEALTSIISIIFTYVNDITSSHSPGCGFHIQK